MSDKLKESTEVGLRVVIVRKGSVHALGLVCSRHGLCDNSHDEGKPLMVNRLTGLHRLIMICISRADKLYKLDGFQAIHTAITHAPLAS